ncbi:MAG: ethanolamine ammonia-lyase subunit EutC [Gemmataceae bacterium]
MSDNALSQTPGPLGMLREHTPARVLVGRAGSGYRTGTWLKLREDHAAARDAVRAEVDLDRDLGTVRELFNVRTRATSKGEYLLRPDLGRQLDGEARQRVRSECPAGVDLQVVIGDGLSATAVASQAPALLEGLRTAAAERGWSFGRPFFVRYCRVGVLNDVGELLNPAVVVLLIGERPGLATAESLSAYMAFRPRTGHTDADRNLISNIHARGVSTEEAIRRVIALAEQFRIAGRSGVAVKELFPAVAALPTTPS